MPCPALLSLLHFFLVMYKKLQAHFSHKYRSPPMKHHTHPIDIDIWHAHPGYQTLCISHPSSEATASEVQVHSNWDPGSSLPYQPNARELWGPSSANATSGAGDAAAGKLPEDVGVPKGVQQNAGRKVTRAHEQAAEYDAQHDQGQEALKAEMRGCETERADQHGRRHRHVARQRRQQKPPEDGLLPDRRAHRHHHKVYRVAHLHKQQYHLTLFGEIRETLDVNHK
jgi:hypothetical protein